MKKVFLFILLTFFAALSYAQTQYNTQFITLENDTIQAKLTKAKCGCNDVNHWLQKAFINGKKTNLLFQRSKYKRMIVKISGNKFIYDLKKIPVIFIKQKLFVKLLVDGRIKLYYHNTKFCVKNTFIPMYDSDGKPAGMGFGKGFERKKPFEAYYIEQNGKIKKIRKKNFEKQPELYLPNAPQSLVQKIKSKNYSFRKIVEEYNIYLENMATKK